jgi:hypothetical protein
VKHAKIAKKHIKHVKIAKHHATHIKLAKKAKHHKFAKAIKKPVKHTVKMTPRVKHVRLAKKSTTDARSDAPAAPKLTPSHAQAVAGGRPQGPASCVPR